MCLVYCKKYIGGNGVEVWDATDDSHVNALRDSNYICSIFPTFHGMNDKSRLWWRSVTGEMPSSLSVTQEVNESVWYPGSSAVANYWEMHTNARDYAHQQYKCTTSEANRKQNVICMQEVQLKWNPALSNWSTVVRDFGHWGDKVYPGCNQVREGKKSTFETPSYMELRTTSLY